MPKARKLFLALFVISGIVAVSGFLRVNNQKRNAGPVSQIKVSPAFEDLVEDYESGVPCKTELEIDFVKQVATLADADLAYKVAEHSCERFEVRAVLGLKARILLPRALAEARTFEEKIAVLELSKETGLHHWLCYSLVDEAQTFGDFVLLGNTGGFCECESSRACPNDHAFSEYLRAVLDDVSPWIVGNFSTLEETFSAVQVLKTRFYVDGDLQEELACKFETLTLPDVYEDIESIRRDWELIDYTLRYSEDNIREIRRSMRSKLAFIATTELLNQAKDGDFVVNDLAVGTPWFESASSLWERIAREEIEVAYRQNDLDRLRNLYQRVPKTVEAELGTRIAALYGVSQ